MVLLTIAFIAAIVVHEGNHALVATALGDDTPRRAGRLSLNPMRHIDMTGLIMFVLVGFGWGWTPVNPQNLRPNPRTGNAIVAAAGPLANLALAFLLSVPLRTHMDLSVPVYTFLRLAMLLNLLLFCFNLIPLPPLDGFTVLVGVLPRHIAFTLKRLERYGPGLLLALLLLPTFIGIDIVGMVFRSVSRVFGV
jgi:Zn-dependent protease